jgi:hypothetical protein
VKKPPLIEAVLHSCFLQSEVRAVLGDEARLVGGHVFLGEDRADRAGWDARAAVNALVGVNVELVVTFVDALHGANFDAGAVLRADAGLGNNVCHGGLLVGAGLGTLRTVLLRIVLARTESHVKRDKLECFTRD